MSAADPTIAERSKRHRAKQLAKATAQAKRVEELSEALRRMVYETTSLSPMEPDGAHWCRISADALSQSRQALGGDA